MGQTRGSFEYGTVDQMALRRLRNLNSVLSRHERGYVSGSFFLEVTMKRLIKKSEMTPWASQLST